MRSVFMVRTCLNAHSSRQSTAESFNTSKSVLRYTQMAAARPRVELSGRAFAVGIG